MGRCFGTTGHPFEEERGGARDAARAGRRELGPARRNPMRRGVGSSEDEDIGCGRERIVGLIEALISAKHTRAKVGRRLTTDEYRA